MLRCPGILCSSSTGRSHAYVNFSALERAGVREDVADPPDGSLTVILPVTADRWVCASAATEPFWKVIPFQLTRDDAGRRST